MRKFLTTGLFGAILGLLVGAPADASLISRSFLDQALTDYATNTALDLKADKADVTDLSDKIGILPEGITVQGMLEGWTDENGLLANPGLKGIYEGWIGNNGLQTLGLQELELDSFYTYNPENDSPQLVRGQKGGLLYILSHLLGSNQLGDYGYSMDGGELAPFWKLTESAYKTDELSDKIGTLPSGKFPLFPRHELFFPVLNQPLTYPTSLAELITAIYGNSETGVSGLLEAIIAGFPFDIDGDGQFDFNVGTLPNFMLAAEAKALATTNTAKIGTLPSGNFPKFPGYELLFPELNQPFTYPTSLAELITAIYGNSETGGLLAGIIAGFEFDTDGDGQFDSRVGTILNFNLATEAKELATTANTTATAAQTTADSAVEKIGTLPTEYATVGAALTAIKGIAEDAKAAALAAIPDPKTEGSTGKFVLTVDIVGDNATYRWEKIDREGETTTTTE